VPFSQTRGKEEGEEKGARNVHRAGSLANRAKKTRVENLPRRVLDLALDIVDVRTGGLDARRLKRAGGLSGGGVGSPGGGGGRGGRTGGGVGVGFGGSGGRGGGGEHDGGSCVLEKVVSIALCYLGRKDTASHAMPGGDLNETFRLRLRSVEKTTGKSRVVASTVPSTTMQDRVAKEEGKNAHFSIDNNSSDNDRFFSIPTRLVFVGPRRFFSNATVDENRRERSSWKLSSVELPGLLARAGLEAMRTTVAKRRKREERRLSMLGGIV
jgi:hypothetical protein